MLQPSTPFLVDPDQRTTAMVWTVEKQRKYIKAVA
jgi:hypothetical protein